MKDYHFNIFWGIWGHNTDLRVGTRAAPPELHPQQGEIGVVSPDRQLAQRVAFALSLSLALSP